MGPASDVVGQGGPSLLVNAASRNRAAQGRRKRLLERVRRVLDEVPDLWVRLLTLTQVEDDEALFWSRVDRFCDLLRLRARFEWAGAYEVGKRGHGHGHLVTWGDYVPVDRYAELWSLACGGRGIVYIQAVKSGSADAVARYALKGVSNYVTKGGRRVHYSRRFVVFGARLLDELRRAK